MMEVRKNENVKESVLQEDIMLEIERNTEETENSKKELGLRKEDMTQKGSRKMCIFCVLELVTIEERKLKGS